MSCPARDAAGAQQKVEIWSQRVWVSIGVRPGLILLFSIIYNLPEAYCWYWAQWTPE